eukprot:gene11424-13280_t
MDITLPKLEYLCLVGSVQDNFSCVAFVKLTRQLACLALGSLDLTSSVIIEAVQYCPHLRYFEAPRVFDIDNALSEVIKACPQMLHLDLSHCKHLTDVGIIAVARNVKGLRSIHFTYSKLITNKSLQQLSEHHHITLEGFAVYESEELGFSEPTSGVPIEDNQTITNASLSIFREKCANLRVFDWKRYIYGLSWTPADTVVSQVASADKVTTLTLNLINDATLSAVASNCHQLVMLNMYDSSVIDCSDTMCRPKLQGLNVSHCLAERVKQLYAAHPHIQVHSSSDSVYTYNVHSRYQRDRNVKDSPRWFL